ncbi:MULTISPECIES: fimbrial protein [unclassified Lysobacter]|uniref:fimbrial protein n=1 Tax=unclassified Lysobacter TaxID=2635362 RepID=UPI001C22274E|nr:fimbrial protein [Lysobacter sp. MMG2]MBU8977299.1 type 1 fimbrial protein [Lysobacter sp. MMG2]
MKLPARSDSAPRTAQQVRAVMRLLAMLAMLAGLSALPWSAKAGPATSDCTAAAQNFTLGAVTVEPNAPVGALLGTPASITMVFSCTNIPVLDTTKGHGLYIQAGDLAGLDATDTEANGIVFDTNLNGIGLKITGTPFQAKSEPCVRCGPNSTRGFEIGPIDRASNGTGSISNTFTAQLIKTGTITPGTVSQISRLMRFYWYEYGVTSSVGTIGNLRLNGGTTVTVPTCLVNSDSALLAVPLPTVSSASLTGAVGTVAGRTRFNINMRCQVGSRVRITMDSARQGTGTGVVMPTTSGTGPWAANVGVQILNGTFGAVAFDSAVLVGTTPAAGTWSVPYYAQYYRYSTATVTAGKVAATVTYTLSYD